MGLPIILMFVFLGKSLTLDGSSEGVKAYIGEWDVSLLREDGAVWSVAVSQIFFSLSITFGKKTRLYGLIIIYDRRELISHLCSTS